MYVVSYLPVGGIGVGPSGIGVMLPPQRKFESLEAAKAADVPSDFIPRIEGPEGIYTYGGGQWQFTPRRNVGNMQVDVFFGAGNWCGFTPPNAVNNLPPDHGPWRAHITRWLFVADHPLDRIVPEQEIRAGIEARNFYQCQLSDDQMKWLKGESK
jgi:hypothetical protein